MGKEIEVDGSLGEGGGQSLRTSLALSAITGKPVTIKNIRAFRPRPGLRPQHLASVKAIASICSAAVKGAEISSSTLSFYPKKVSPANLNINIGTAGSVSLLLSQILPVSLLGKVKLHVSGGTNVSFSPPMEFLKEVLFPQLRKMGARLEAKAGRLGYYPKGNGFVSFCSQKAGLPLKPVTLLDFGELEFVKVYSHCASLPKKVAEGQARAARHSLSPLNTEFDECIECREAHGSIGSGITLLACTTTGVVLSGSALGRKGVPASRIGQEAAQALLKQLNSKKACDFHLADQLAPFMALANGKSEIETGLFTKHCSTNISVVEKFLPVKFEVEGSEGKPALIKVNGVGFKQTAWQ